MGVYSPEQYHALQRKRLAMLMKNAKRGEILGAEKYATRLRMYVPIKSGKLKRSINRKGNTVRVGATGTDGFPYVHWINQTSPEFVTLKFPNGAWLPPSVTGRESINILPKGGVATYGLQPSTWNWTGRVRFAQRALFETRKDWQVLIQKINKKSLMVESI
jgi:hypothetical protein